MKTNLTFTEINAGLLGMILGLAAWGDYDNDGKLDLLLAGAFVSPAGGGLVSISRIYRNFGLVTNTPPVPPNGLTAIVAGTGVRLSWQAATDAQTPPAGLAYNLRVGSTPGGADVVPPQADLSSGWRRQPQMGAWHGLTASLTNLPPRTYYWSVQAVDTALAGSPFATAGSSFQTGRPTVAYACPQSVFGTSAVLLASVNPEGLATTGYIEWGTNTLYGNRTASGNLGTGSNFVPFRQSLGGCGPALFTIAGWLPRTVTAQPMVPTFSFTRIPPRFPAT